MSYDTVSSALMPRTSQVTSDTDLRRAARNLPPVGFVSGNQPQKDAERAELERQLVEFARRGGQVQVLGNSAINHGKSRRQASAGRAQRLAGATQS